VTLEVKEIVDGAMGGNEALGLALRLEALHLSLSLERCELKAAVGFCKVALKDHPAHERLKMITPQSGCDQGNPC
jgi:hypothetical protein